MHDPSWRLLTGREKGSSWRHGWIHCGLGLSTIPLASRGSEGVTRCLPKTRSELPIASIEPAACTYCKTTIGHYYARRLLFDWPLRIGDRSGMANGPAQGCASREPKACEFRALALLADGMETQCRYPMELLCCRHLSLFVAVNKP